MSQLPPNTAPSPEQWYQQGCELLAGDDLASAVACFGQAVALAPDFAQAHVNLGFALDALGDAPGAEQAYLEALACGADYAELHLNYGALLLAQRRLDAAQRCYAHALRCAPESSAVWSNLGVLWLMQKQDDEARRCLEKALQLDPGNAKAHLNLAYLHLRHGRFDTGWMHLEARQWYGPVAEHFACPRWGGEALAGKSVLVCYEAGHGDVIQFCRYIPMLRARGATQVTLICHPALKSLMQTLAGVSTVAGFDEALPPTRHDFWAPLLSLACQFKTRADSIPAAIPYLAAQPQAVARWAAQLPASGLRVGLVWQGNRAFENDSERSLPDLRTLAPLQQVSDVHWVSLQKGEGEGDCMRYRADFPVQDLGSSLQDFADTAALVCCLDLVICVDTAVAHLAGALGKPCWVMLPDFMTDWRWLSHGDTSAWYPGSLRLFRQPQRGDWAAVVQQMVQALGEGGVAFRAAQARSAGSSG